MLPEREMRFSLRFVDVFGQHRIRVNEQWLFDLIEKPVFVISLVTILLHYRIAEAVEGSDPQ